MGEVNATIYLKEGEPEKGWGYTHWVLDVGKGQGAVQEDVQILCAERSQRYMSRVEAMQEAKARIKVRIAKECGSLPDSQVHWAVKSPLREPFETPARPAPFDGAQGRPQGERS